MLISHKQNFRALWTYPECQVSCTSTLTLAKRYFHSLLFPLLSRIRQAFLTLRACDIFGHRSCKKGNKPRLTGDRETFSYSSLIIIIITITYREKLLNADWLRWRALLVIKRAWLLDPDWFKVAYQRGYCWDLLPIKTMASQFVEADEGFIEELRNTSENKNTKISRDYSTNIFQQ